MSTQVMQAFAEVHDPAKAFVAGILAPLLAVIGLLVLLAGSPSVFTMVAIFGGLVLSGVALAHLNNDQVNGNQIIYDRQIPNRTLWCTINVILSLIAFIIYRLKNPTLSTPPTTSELEKTNIVAVASISLWLSIFYFGVIGAFVYFDHLRRDSEPSGLPQEEPMIARGAPSEHPSE